LPSDVDNDNDSGFITEDDDDGNLEVKMHRINIANAMWESYLNYLANAGTVDSDSDLSSLDE
jgi:hypothetical protein